MIYPRHLTVAFVSTVTGLLAAGSIMVPAADASVIRATITATNDTGGPVNDLEFILALEADGSGGNLLPSEAQNSRPFSSVEVGEQLFTLGGIEYIYFDGIPDIANGESVTVNILFDSAFEGWNASGAQGTWTYNGNFVDFVFDEIVSEAIIPLPASIGLLAGGLAGLGIVARKRTRCGRA